MAFKRLLSGQNVTVQKFKYFHIMSSVRCNPIILQHCVESVCKWLKVLGIIHVLYCSGLGMNVQ